MISRLYLWRLVEATEALGWIRRCRLRNQIAATSPQNPVPPKGLKVVYSRWLYLHSTVPQNTTHPGHCKSRCRLYRRRLGCHPFPYRLRPSLSVGYAASWDQKIRSGPMQMVSTPVCPSLNVAGAAFRSGPTLRFHLTPAARMLIPTGCQHARASSAHYTSPRRPTSTPT
jgi:hypothetical protein